MRLPVTGRDALSMLNGFLCLYKPKDLPMSALKKRLVSALCKEANEQFGSGGWNVPTIEVPVVRPHSVSEALVVVGTREQLDYSHPMMIGEMFRPEDIQLEELTELEPSSSGVCVLGINDGCDELGEIRDRGWLSEYFIEGLLGQETHKNEIRGKVIRKAEYEHVTRHYVSKLLSKVRANFKRYTFGLANVNLESQHAFELARKGTPRQRIMGAPVVYSVELSKFHSPHLTINVQASSESDPFLRPFRQLMYSIGADLGTLACTRRLRRVRQGPFTLDHALLDKHFHVMAILRNILMSNQVVKTALAEDPDIIQVREQSELASSAMVERFRLDSKHLEEEAPEPDDCLYLPWGRDYEK